MVAPALSGGVVFVCGLPSGFDQDALRAYLRQFGKVRRLNVMKNKRGTSRGFAFVEFGDREVARIVAESLSGYIMFSKTLKAELLPPGSTKASTFRVLTSTTELRRSEEKQRALLRDNEPSAASLVRHAGADLKLRMTLKELGVADCTPASILPPLSKPVIARIEQLEGTAVAEASERRAHRLKQLQRQYRYCSTYCR
eukprot:Lankesteria_metandrocarpae@DN2382_c0_g1_i2.p1